jgi:ribosome-associated protein
MVKSRRAKQDDEALVRRVADLALNGKALDVVVIDVRGQSSYTDFLVIASGTSDRHVQSVAEGIDEALRASGMRAIGTEGLREGQWALLDYGSVVVHVFHQFTRGVYKLEELWAQARRLTIEAAPAVKTRRR